MRGLLPRYWAVDSVMAVQLVLLLKIKIDIRFTGHQFCMPHAYIDTEVFRPEEFFKQSIVYRVY